MDFTFKNGDMRIYRNRLLVFYMLKFSGRLLKAVCLAVIITFGIAEAWALSNQPQGLIIIENDQSFKRVAEIISIEKSKLKNIPAGCFPLIKKSR